MTTAIWSTRCCRRFWRADSPMSAASGPCRRYRRFGAPSSSISIPSARSSSCARLGRRRNRRCSTASLLAAVRPPRDTARTGAAPRGGDLARAPRRGAHMRRSSESELRESLVRLGAAVEIDGVPWPAPDGAVPGLAELCARSIATHVIMAPGASILDEARAVGVSGGAGAILIRPGPPARLSGDPRGRRAPRCWTRCGRSRKRSATSS